MLLTTIKSLYYIVFHIFNKAPERHFYYSKKLFRVPVRNGLMGRIRHVPIKFVQTAFLTDKEECFLSSKLVLSKNFRLSRYSIKTILNLERKFAFLRYT